MEDENYRILILSKLATNLESKTGPDDHVQDVVSGLGLIISAEAGINYILTLIYSQCVTKPVYKGILKVLLTVIYGLEVSVANSGLGGLSSAFRVLEISHTHFWTKDLMDNVQHGLCPHSGTEGNSSDVSQYGSRENLDLAPDSLGSVGTISPYPSMSSNLPSLEPITRTDNDSSNLLRELIMKKKQLLLGRLSSADSEAEDAASVAASDTGSMTTNPAFQRGGRGFSSIRSAVSDNEMDDRVSRDDIRFLIHSEIT